MVIPYPHMPPTIVSIGPIAIRWYSLMYVIGYVLLGCGVVLLGVIYLHRAPRTDQSAASRRR